MRNKIDKRDRNKFNKAFRTRQEAVQACNGKDGAKTFRIGGYWHVIKKMETTQEYKVGYLCTDGCFRLIPDIEGVEYPQPVNKPKRKRRPQGSIAV